MLEMFLTPDEITPEEIEKAFPLLVGVAERNLKALVRGVANAARAKALDEAYAVVSTAPIPNAEKAAERIHTLERKSHY